MSRMLCKCGATMGTSMCPSPYSIAIYYEREVNQAIADNPRILLSDFLTDWDEINDTQKKYMKRTEDVDYWYCPECQRVYETQIQIGGHWLRVYQKIKHPIPIITYESWSRIIVMKDVDTDAALEAKPGILLSDYLSTHEKFRYLLSQDEKKIVALSALDSEVKYAYVLEEVYSTEK